MAQLKPDVGPQDHRQGDAGAAITLVEYGDYQCPYCGQAYRIVKELQRRFGMTLRFVFRNFPLTDVHEFAMGAAEVAEAAGMQGKFWQMHDWLYEHQTMLDPPNLIKAAASLQLDLAKLRADILDTDPARRVQIDYNGGVESGVKGTPAFFVNGAPVVGNWTNVDAFAAAIARQGAIPSA